mmetsp:Transcript_2864/g.11495  ORF Transcript_2864/g.11495 Transcript_2864/m.11495 type:complete len:282 (+) Transcript_2864:400-1245(+)
MQRPRRVRALGLLDKDEPSLRVCIGWQRCLGGGDDHPTHIAAVLIVRQDEQVPARCQEGDAIVAQSDWRRVGQTEPRAAASALLQRAVALPCPARAAPRRLGLPLRSRRLLRLFELPNLAALANSEHRIAAEHNTTRGAHERVGTSVRRARLAKVVPRPRAFVPVPSNRHQSTRLSAQKQLPLRAGSDRARDSSRQQAEHDAVWWRWQSGPPFVNEAHGKQATVLVHHESLVLTEHVRVRNSADTRSPGIAAARWHAEALPRGCCANMAAKCSCGAEAHHD